MTSNIYYFISFAFVFCSSLSPSIYGQTTGGYFNPPGCTGNACKYALTWSLNIVSDVITFNLRVNQTNDKWLAIGFGQIKEMMRMDMVYGYINSSGQGYVRDAWVEIEDGIPADDPIQNLFNVSLTSVNGFLTLIFSRQRNTNDLLDWKFSDSPNDCYYFMYPVGGGSHTDNSITKHDVIPIMSDLQIGISTVTLQPSPQPPLILASTSKPGVTRTVTTIKASSGTKSEASLMTPLTLTMIATALVAHAVKISY